MTLPTRYTVHDPNTRRRPVRSSPVWPAACCLLAGVALTTGAPTMATESARPDSAATTVNAWEYPPPPPGPYSSLGISAKGYEAWFDAPAPVSSTGPSTGAMNGTSAPQRVDPSMNRRPKPQPDWAGQQPRRPVITPETPGYGFQPPAYPPRSRHATPPIGTAHKPVPDNLEWRPRNKPIGQTARDPEFRPLDAKPARHPSGSRQRPSPTPPGHLGYPTMPSLTPPMTPRNPVAGRGSNELPANYPPVQGAWDIQQPPQDSWWSSGAKDPADNAIPPPPENGEW